MKIEEAKIQAMTSEVFETKAFRVDQKMAQILFRDKLYTAEGKIRVIAQEYMANARDAHRSAGKSDTPIEVELPTKLSPEFVVRDFGRGISPKEVDEIFVVYGASTKQGSNDQNGGYGIGAKCAFSYVKAFAVTTTVQGVRYIYSAHVDADNMNQFSLIDTGPAVGPDGTEVRVPIKAEDVYKLNRWVKEVTHAWSPRPTITPVVDYLVSSPQESGDHWDLYGDGGPFRYDHGYYGIIVTSDDIPYELTYTQAMAVSDNCTRLHSLLQEHNKTLVFKFKVGEVTIPPQRESLDMTPRTNSALNKAVADFISAELDKAKVLTDKCKTVAEMCKLTFDPPFEILVGEAFGVDKQSAGGLTFEHNCTEIGVVVYTYKRKDEKLKEWKAHENITIKEMLRHEQRKMLVIDGCGKALKKDVLRPLIMDTDLTYSSQVVVIVDPALLLSKTSITMQDFVDMGDIEVLIKPTGAAAVRVKGQSGYIFAPQLSFSYDKWNSVASLDGCTKKTYASDSWIQTSKFIHYDKAGVRYTFNDVPVTQDELKALLVYSQFINKGESYIQGSFMHWQDRYENFKQDDQTKAVFLEDYIDNLVTGALTSNTRALRKLGMIGIGSYTMEQDWLFPSSSNMKEKFLRTHLPQGLFSEDFFALMDCVLEMEAGDIAEGPECVKLIKKYQPTFETLCGSEIRRAVQKQLDLITEAKLEFLNMFKVKPELEWLMPLCASNTTVRKRVAGANIYVSTTDVVKSVLSSITPVNPAFKA